MAKKKEISLMDFLPPEAHVQIDKLAYDFLAARGYDTEGAIDSEDKRKALGEELKKRGEELRYSEAFNKKTKCILIWFEIYKDNERAARSQGLKFLPKDFEGGNDGEGREDITDKDRPSPTS